MAKGSLRSGVDSATKAPATKKKNAKAASPKAPKKNDREVESPPPRSVEEFEPIAKILMDNPSSWLAEHLRGWSTSVLINYAVETRQPTRIEMRAMLSKIADGASLLIRGLGYMALVEFLDAGAAKAPHDPGKLQALLVDLRDRAQAASKLPALVDDMGKSQSGRGRAVTKVAFSAQTYCALLIAETWKYFKGAYPPPRNRRAQEAADNYWRLACGKRNPTWGNDEFVAWRRHLKNACEMRSEEADKLRAECLRHLRESEASAKILDPEN